MTQLFTFDEALRQNEAVLCGVDEAGRGPLAGPVCCAAVILPKEAYIEGVNDSKKLSEKKRDLLFEVITKTAVCYNIVLIGPEIIDEINILQATLLGMKQAVEGLPVVPGLTIIDGNKAPPLKTAVQCITGGDGISASIAAASILAKVTRDNYMKTLGELYPEYRLDKHKGYPTALHYAKIKEYGIQPFHRRSFLKNLKG